MGQWVVYTQVFNRDPVPWFFVWITNDHLSKQDPIFFSWFFGRLSLSEMGDVIFIPKTSPTQFWDWPACWLWMMVLDVQVFLGQFSGFGSSWMISMETSFSIIPSVIMTNHIGKPLCLIQAILSWAFHYSMTVENVFLLSFEWMCLCFWFFSFFIPTISNIKTIIMWNMCCFQESS